MPAPQKRTFELPPEQADYIDAKVEAGSYASANDVVSAGIEALQDRDADMERWLREEVLPVVKAMEADPGRAISGEQLEARLLEHHAHRMRNGGT